VTVHFQEIIPTLRLKKRSDRTGCLLFVERKKEKNLLCAYTYNIYKDIFNNINLDEMKQNKNNYTDTEALINQKLTAFPNKKHKKLYANINMLNMKIKLHRLVNT